MKDEKGHVLFSLLIVVACILMILTLIFVDTRMGSRQLESVDTQKLQDTTPEPTTSTEPSETPEPSATPTPTPTPESAPLEKIPTADSSVSKEKLPKTGEWKLLGFSIGFVVLGISIIIAYKKFKNIDVK